MRLLSGGPGTYEEVAAMGVVFWVCSVGLVLAGAVGLARGRTPEGVMLIVAGLLVGPVAISIFLPPPG